MLMLINALISSFILLMDKLNMCIVKKGFNSSCSHKIP